MLERLIKIQSDYYSELNLDQIQPLYEGQNNYVYSDGQIIVRIPKNQLNNNKMKKEIETLRKINSHLPLKTPKLIAWHVDEDFTQSFMIYENISGRNLSRDVFDTIDNKNMLAKQLANFLITLHKNSDIQSMASNYESSDVLAYWKDLHKRFQDKLYTFMREDAKKDMDNNFDLLYKSISKQAINNCLIHGDFGPTNILYDQEKQCLSGIIDFSEMRVSDPAYDIAALIGFFGYGLSFAESMIPHYPEIEYYIERAKLYQTTFALQEALYGVEEDDQRAFEAGIERYI